jgi:RecJ-like exonuclease
LCAECEEKRKEEKRKHDEFEARRNAARDVYVLDSLCEMRDMDKDKLYKGKITRIERYGAFVTLNNNVWGLMRGDVSEYHVGDEVIVFITSIKSRERKIDLAPAYVESYNLKRMSTSIPRTLIN